MNEPFPISLETAVSHFKEVHSRHLSITTDLIKELPNFWAQFGCMSDLKQLEAMLQIMDDEALVQVLQL